MVDVYVYVWVEGVMDGWVGRRLVGEWLDIQMDGQMDG